MLRLNEVKAPLDHNEDVLIQAIVDKLSINRDELLGYTIFKRSYDARKKSNILLIYHLDVVLVASAEAKVLEQFSQQSFVKISPDMSYELVCKAEDDFPNKDQQRPIIIGFGPCGILAALLLAQMGLRPIVLDRGQDVRQRTKDTWDLWKKGKIDTESNVQFGEGGAGTFSDGKLYSQVKDKRFLSRKVMAEFVKAGAPEEILMLSKPHIGTFRLVSMVEKMRAEITALGGEVRFGHKVETIHREHNPDDSGQITGLTLSSGESLYSRHIILAIGHSARDTFEMLLEYGVYIESKPFSIGFRIEHPQSVIDDALFGEQAGNATLGAADYH